MSVVLIFASVLIGILTVIYWYFKYKFSYWSRLGVPHDPPSIPFGNLQNIKKVDFSKLVQSTYTKFKHKSPIVGLYFFTEPFAVVTDSDLLKHIMISDFDHFHDRGIYYNEKDDPLSAHLFLLSGRKWKTLRAKMTPTFTSGRMKFMFPTIVEVAHRFTDLLLTITQEEEELEVRELLARFTTDVIGTCAFGIECNSLMDPDAEFRRYGRKIFGKPRGNSFTRALKGAYRKTARTLRMKNTQDDVAEFFMEVVTETVAFRETNNVRRNDFMDLLIQLKNTGRLEDDTDTFVGKVTIDEIGAQAFVFYTAGFETSSATMGYCLYELAVNQSIQERLRGEINDVLENHNNEFTYEAIRDMQYLEQVLCETLRKYPPVPVLARETVRNFKIPNSKLVLEKGVRLFIPALAIHHDPEVYPDPEKFDPDRFGSDQPRLRNSVTFLAFGEGPRNCIGMRFGKLQAKIGLIKLLKNFKFSLGKDTPVPLDLKFLGGILQVRGGIYLKAEQI